MAGLDEIYQRIDSLFEHGLINSLISIVIVIIIALILNKLINKIIKKKIDDPIKIVFPMRIKKIVLISLVLIVILSELSAMQSIMKALLASGGIIAVVIGLASQEAASNIINGFMILTYKPYKIGDFVNVREYTVTGTVIDISMRHSIVETLEKTQVIIPNSIMNKAIIENVSNVKTQKANYLLIEISYESVCVDGRNELQKEQNEPIVKVHCINFNESGIQLRATLLSKDNSDGFQLMSDLRLRIKERFDKEGIDIPYPHRVVINETKESKE